jgi:putative thiamine transport system permease protein
MNRAGGQDTTSLLEFFPGVALFLLAGPVVAGLAGALLPAFGYFPALGGESFSFEPWRLLFAAPGLWKSLLVTLWVGLAATLISLAIVVAIFARFHGGFVLAAIRRMLSPLLSVPHVAVAIGLVFAIAPSGLVFRLLSSFVVEFRQPPDVLIIHDSLGLTLIAGLVLKEVPFLFLMCLAALPQTGQQRSLAAAATLGYAPATAWLKTVLPRLYPQLRLPVLAVLAYSISVVDVAIVLGPTTPPTLPVMVLKWMNDPVLGMRFPASAGAILVLVVTLAAVLLWLGCEQAAARLGVEWMERGARREGARLAGAVAGLSAIIVLALVVLTSASLALWAFADSWRFPEPWPASFTGATWQRHWSQLAGPLANALIIAACAALIALVITIALLERDVRSGGGSGGRMRNLIYVPLIVPQIAFLPGLQILFLALGLDAGIAIIVLVHLLFVLPYVYLSLSDPWNHFDERYRRAALVLGADPHRALMKVRLPMLLAALLTAFAVGFAVSIGQYLPTLLFSSGRVPTITTEAVTLASGGDRRVNAIYALLQAILPFAGFLMAIVLPAAVYANRRGLRSL